MSALLETIDLKKIYKVGKVDVDALRGVNLRINAGEFASIMGPSGCGKSTLMHLMGAMARATSGKVLIEGQNIADMNDGQRTEIRRKKLGFVFQKFNLLPALTARQNLQVARKIYGVTKSSESDAHIASMLGVLQIENKLDRRPLELSGGEQQRVAIARALANRPAVLLADEPTGSLDSKNSEIVMNMFRELNQRLKQTIIIVTHNPELAALTDRLIEMRDGLIVNSEAANETASAVHKGGKG